MEEYRGVCSASLLEVLKVMVVNSELQQGTYCKKRREELLEEYSKVVKEVQEIKEMDRRAEQIKAKNEYPKARLQKECHRKTLMSKLQADHEESVRLAILLEVQAEREESKRWAKSAEDRELELAGV
ncbi:TPA: hypothetical protein ACH3X3_008639 [Trebouxia sp. C0006]